VGSRLFEAILLEQATRRGRTLYHFGRPTERNGFLPTSGALDKFNRSVENDDVESPACSFFAYSVKVAAQYVRTKGDVLITAVTNRKLNIFNPSSEKDFERLYEFIKSWVESTEPSNSQEVGLMRLGASMVKYWNRTGVMSFWSNVSDNKRNWSSMESTGLPNFIEMAGYDGFVSAQESDEDPSTLVEAVALFNPNDVLNVVSVEDARTKKGVRTENLPEYDPNFKDDDD
jgi:hypothetical protein